MKKLKLSLLLLLFITESIICNAQTAPCWFTPAWTWTDTAPSNWNAYFSNNTLQAMGSPFTGNSQSSELNAIIFAGDYLPEQGWTLLFKDFGCVDILNPLNGFPCSGDLAVFILYNKYTGVVRCYFFTGPSPQFHNSSVCNLSWLSPTTPNYNNSLLSLANNYPQPNNAYPKPNNTETFFNQIKYPNGTGWFVTEYNVHFDPKTYNTVFGQQLQFSFTLGSMSTIALNGGFTFTTQSSTVLDQTTASTPNASNTNWQDFNVQAKKFLGKIPSKSDVEGAFTTIENNVNTIDGKFCNNFTRDLHNMNNSLQTGELKKFLIGAAGFVPYVGDGLNALSTVVDFFSSKSNSTASNDYNTSVMPTISQGQITLTGSITTEYPGKTLFMQVPYTSHKNALNQRIYPGLPYYDCPLGVISLKQTPNLKKRTYTVNSVANQTVLSVANCVNPPAPGNQNFCTLLTPANAAAFNQVVDIISSTPSQTISQVRRFGTCTAVLPTTLVSYKLDEVLELDHNLASDLSITSAKVALMFEILPVNALPSVVPTATASPFFTSFVSNQCNSIDVWPEAPLIQKPLNIATFNVSETGYVNQTRANLDAGILKLSNYDNVNKNHKFQTQFVDFDKAKGLSATFQDGTVKVYVKVALVLKPNNLSHDQTPITKVLTYEVTNFTNDNTSSSPYPYICEQLDEIEPEAYGTVCNIGNGVTISAANLASPLITNLCDLTINPHLNTPNTTTTWQADKLIKMQAPFRATVAGTDLFKAKISPTGQCLAGVNALQVNTYFPNCDNNPQNHRIANLTQTQGVDSSSINKLTSDNNSLKISVMPNPSNGKFTVQFNLIHPEGDITILDNMSRKVLSQHVLIGETAEINMSHASAGIYFIIFTNNKNLVLTKKLIIN